MAFLLDKFNRCLSYSHCYILQTRDSMTLLEVLTTLLRRCSTDLMVLRQICGALE
jgi:hypothetical protein